MLATTARSLARVSRKVKPLILLTEKYDFIPIESRDHGMVMDTTRKGFYAVDPHSRALGIASHNGGEFMDWIVSNALKYPYGIRVMHKETGKMIGVRLMSEWRRDGKDTRNDFDFTKLDENTMMFAKILGNLKTQIWSLRPEAEKVLRREVIYVDRVHQGQGIGQYLMHLDLDFDQLRSSGFDGIMAESTSFASQLLLTRNGYKILAMSKPKELIRSNGQRVELPDEAEAAKLLYLPFKKS
ncbi:hypothetical protein PMAYCL1PPCAC_14862 [Pristionchus mayeri]|uniref:Acetyltransferase n=1 Tax=Pristionchus mayeri TaxID=1317129 RepID=A0AAN5HXA1_9BILA|nr:hypothetical protein PMAYCL1PPCAC_14862 [Pristionchus mayeri]